MNDLDKLWRQIEKDFDSQEDIDTQSYLDQISLSYAEIPESIFEESEELVNQVFDEDSLAKNSKLSKYNILKKIDSGGQSEIYLAERSDGISQMTVVIKFISAQDSFATLQQQFLQEMQLLADLNHPGIVHIIDGGLTETDQPWLVLDYIEGPAIDQYCLQSKSDHKSIVKQLIKLCDAIDYVHQNGAVHMDIKPSNILIKEINSTPYPVLIDFGIALSTTSNQQDDQQMKFGTPGFSAPEQMQGTPTDLRADVYSLGMMLAQLITQKDTQNIGLLSEKQRLRLLQKHTVAKDLIQIINKCTQNNPQDRYSNAESFRTDLNNYINDLPLMINRDQFFHVLTKTIKRNRLISSMILLVLISSLFFGLKYTKDISDLQKITLKQKNASDQLLNFMQTDLFEELKELGRIDVLKQVTDQSIQHLQNQDQRSLDSQAHYQSSIAYANAGKVYDNLDQSETALFAYNEALKSIRFLDNNLKYEYQFLKQNALIRVLKARTLTAEGQNQNTTENLIESLKYSQQLNLKFPEEDYFLQYEAYTQLGWHYLEYDESEKALVNITKAIKIAEDSIQQFNNNRWKYYLSQVQQAKAWYGFDYAESNEAIQVALEATKVARLISIEEPTNILYLINLATILNQLSFLYMETEQYSKAQQSVDESIQLGLLLQQRAPNNFEYLRELAYSYTTAGELAELDQKLELALKYYQKGLDISKKMAQTDAGNYSTINDYAVDLIHVGDMMVKLDKLQLAQDYWSQALLQIKPVYHQESNNKYYTHTLTVAIIKNKNYQQAKPLIIKTIDAGMSDNQFEQLLHEHNLESFLKK
jgi:serine/threonine protein kinase